MNDFEYAKLSVNMAKQSFKEGAFPAGAIIVKDDKIISKQISAKYPNFHLHAESKAIDDAITKLNDQLTNCTLYASMEPCLMCLSRAYWAGIRRIVFVVNKEKVDSKICYESDINQKELVTKFNEKIEIINIKDLEEDALNTYSEWLSNQ
jgi:tRNA(Arg) A34 adenosine deaminase TadA